MRGSFDEEAQAFEDESDEAKEPVLSFIEFEESDAKGRYVEEEGAANVTGENGNFNGNGAEAGKKKDPIFVTKNIHVPVNQKIDQDQVHKAGSQNGAKVKSSTARNITQIVESVDVRNADSAKYVSMNTLKLTERADGVSLQSNSSHSPNRSETVLEVSQLLNCNDSLSQVNGKTEWPSTATNCEIKETLEISVLGEGREDSYSKGQYEENQSSSRSLDMRGSLQKEENVNHSAGGGNDVCKPLQKEDNGNHSAAGGNDVCNPLTNAGREDGDCPSSAAASGR